MGKSTNRRDPNAPPLTLARLKQVVSYDAETGIFTRLSTGKPTGRPGEKSGRGQIWIDREIYLAHRLAWFYVHGEWPAGVIDHMRTRSDEIGNLRDVTRRVNNENQRRARSTSKSGVLGASWSKDRKTWASYITANGKSQFLGYFASPQEAGAAYVVAKRQQHEGCTL